MGRRLIPVERSPAARSTIPACRRGLALHLEDSIMPRPSKSPKGSFPGAVPLIDIVKRFPCLREPVVDGIARRGETVNIIAPSKVGKTYLAWGLALSIAHGQPWLGKFKTRQGRVLYLDNELHEETISYRGRLVSEAMGLTLYGIDVRSLRGQILDYKQLREEVGLGVRGIYVAVVVDSHYRMLPEGITENDNAGMARVYNLIDSMACVTDATWYLIHHSTKGSQIGKSNTDIGAGAGSQSRAADAHITLQKIDDDSGDCYALEGSCRSFPPLAPIPVRWAYPLWTPDLTVNPDKLESPKTRQRKRENRGKEKDLMSTLSRHPEGISANSAARKSGMGKSLAEKMLEKLVSEGRATSAVGESFGNQATLYFPVLPTLKLLRAT